MLKHTKRCEKECERFVTVRLQGYTYFLWTSADMDTPTARFCWPVLLLCYVDTIFPDLINYFDENNVIITDCSYKNEIPIQHISKDYAQFVLFYMVDNVCIYINFFMNVFFFSTI